MRTGSVYIRSMDTKQPLPAPAASPAKKPADAPADEVGGAKRQTDPARFGDWEINGKCVDF